MSADACDLLCLELPHAEEVRAGLPSLEESEGAAALAKALSDPNRLRVAAALAATDELCVCDLAWVCALPQNLVSHHVRQLRSAGLARSRRDGRMVLYALTDVGRALLGVVTATKPPGGTTHEDAAEQAAVGRG